MPGFVVARDAAVVVVLCMLCACASSPAAKRSSGPPPPNIASGKLTYDRNCAACHGEDGTGGILGPALRHERGRRSHAWIVKTIVDPDFPMPKLYPASLSKADVRNVTAYVETL